MLVLRPTGIFIDGDTSSGPGILMDHVVALPLLTVGDGAVVEHFSYRTRTATRQVVREVYPAREYLYRGNRRVWVGLLFELNREGSIRWRRVKDA